MKHGPRDNYCSSSVELSGHLGPDSVSCFHSKTRLRLEITDLPQLSREKGILFVVFVKSESSVLGFAVKNAAPYQSRLEALGETRGIGECLQIPATISDDGTGSSSIEMFFLNLNQSFMFAFSV